MGVLPKKMGRERGLHQRGDREDKAPIEKDNKKKRSILGAKRVWNNGGGVKSEPNCFVEKWNFGGSGSWVFLGGSGEKGGKGKEGGGGWSLSGNEKNGETWSAEELVRI